MNVLLLADLEGVVGVDRIDHLLEGQPGFAGARALLGAELTAACDGLRRGGAAATGIVISDSHRGGAGPTVDPGALPPGVRVHRGEDDYGVDLLGEVQAVACLGMHAADRGFAPHTLDLSCAWESDGRPVSEADLLLGVAAARGLPAVFLSGDDALDPRGLPFVPTKTALSPVAARSRPLTDVLAELRRAAASRPVAAPALPADKLAIRFRSRWMAERAERAGHRRLDETAVSLEGPTLEAPTLEAAIRRGRALIAAAAGPLGDAYRPWALAEDAAALAARGFARALPPPRPAEARRALTSLLARTDEARGADDWAAALRALTLHMLEGHVPGFFAAQGLGPLLARAQARLSSVPAQFPPSLEPEDAMARLDALYVLHERRSLPGGGLAAGGLAPTDGRGSRRDVDRYLDAWSARDPLHTFVIREMAAQIGLVSPAGAAATSERPYRRGDRLRDLLWVTHLFLLATRYLRQHLPAAGWESLTEELLLAAPALLEQGHLDAAAEVAVCLVTAGESTAPERAAVLAALAAHQRPDGSVIEPGAPHDDPRRRFRHDTHCTAVSLLALATAT